MSDSEWLANFKLDNDLKFAAQMEKTDKLLLLTSQLVDEVGSLRNDIRDIKQSLADVEKRQDLLSDRLDQHIASCSASTSSPADPLLCVTYEILFTGIPSALSKSDNDIIKIILKAIGLEQACLMLIDSREWLPAVPMETDEPGSSQKANFRTIVGRFTSDAIRETIASNSVKLRDFMISKLFGIKGSLKVFARPIWPKPVFEPLVKANAVYKELTAGRSRS